jgi:hypothetical protein
MYQNTVQGTSASSCLLEQKTNHLDSKRYILAVTKKCTGQNLDVKSVDLSFGCLYPHRLPDELHLDVIEIAWQQKREHDSI